MNRPIRLPRPANPQSNFSTARADRGYHQRRGLSTAEQIVSLILRRYGLEETIEETGQGILGQTETGQTEAAQTGPGRAELERAVPTNGAAMIETPMSEAGAESNPAPILQLVATTPVQQQLFSVD